MTFDEYVLLQDQRAATDDGLTFTITFGEFNNGVGSMMFTPEERDLPEEKRNEIIRSRYSDLRDRMVAQYGWTVVYIRTLAEYVVEVLDSRAVTSDGLDFEITFSEFGGATRHLRFTAEEADLPQDERNTIALERYSGLRNELAEAVGWG